MKINRIVAAGLAFVVAVLMSTSVALAAAKPLPTGKVNINTASIEQLQVLPGVGAKLAARIVEYRQKSGNFKTTQELMNVRGVGEKNYAKIETYLSVGDGARSAAR